MLSLELLAGSGGTGRLAHEHADETGDKQDNAQCQDGICLALEMDGHAHNDADDKSEDTNSNKCIEQSSVFQNTYLPSSVEFHEIPFGLSEVVPLYQTNNVL